MNQVSHEFKFLENKHLILESSSVVLAVQPTARASPHGGCAHEAECFACFALVLGASYLWIFLGNRDPWYFQWNIDNRISDGVVSMTLAGSRRVPTYRRNVC